MEAAPLLAIGVADELNHAPHKRFSAFPWTVSGQQHGEDRPVGEMYGCEESLVQSELVRFIQDF